VFFRQRLNVVFHDMDAEPEDEESFGLDALEEHQLVSTLMDEVLADLDAWLASQEAVTDEPAQFAALHGQVSARMDRLRRSGRLPMGGAGHLDSARAGEHPCCPMLAAWQREVARHPHPAARQPVRIEQGGVVLQDWLDHLRLSDDADAVPTWLELSAGKLAKGKGNKKEPPQPRLDKLRLAWVRSLVAACGGVTVQGVLVGSDATLLCQAMDPHCRPRRPASLAEGVARRAGCAGAAADAHGAGQGDRGGGA
jgi:exodeoxyribonuclease V gamma subunit